MAEGQQTAVGFNLEKIYVKDISYEAPNTPRIFLEKTAPEVNLQLGIEHSALSAQDGIYDVALVVTATAKIKEETLFLVEAKQAGIFRITGIPAEELVKVLEITCPGILLPFIREVVNELVTKGGFPPLLINPINFESLFQQKHGAAAAAQPRH